MPYPMCIILICSVVITRTVYVFPHPATHKQTRDRHSTLAESYPWVDAHQSVKPHMRSPKLTVCYAVGYPRVSLRVFSDLPCEFPVHFPCIPSPVNYVRRSVVSSHAFPSLSLCPFSFWSARSLSVPP